RVFILKLEQAVRSYATQFSPSDDTLALSEFLIVYKVETYRKRLYLHSVWTVPIQSMSYLIVHSLAIHAANVLTSGNSIANRNFTASGALTFCYSNVAMAIGSSGILKIDPLESGLAYLGTTWARTNLYRHTETGFHRYRFYPQNIQTNDPRSYFSFKG